jgi:hypothetical protein
MQCMHGCSWRTRCFELRELAKNLGFHHDLVGISNSSECVGNWRRTHHFIMPSEWLAHAQEMWSYIWPKSFSQQWWEWNRTSVENRNWEFFLFHTFGIYRLLWLICIAFNLWLTTLIMAEVHGKWFCGILVRIFFHPQIYLLRGEFHIQWVSKGRLL